MDGITFYGRYFNVITMNTQSFMIPVITMIHASLQAEQTCSACNIFL